MAAKDKSIKFYDDKEHDYRDFWIGRDYEHLSEVVAINKLLKGSHFNKAMDYGGGYGRLAEVILSFADHLALVEPSTQQLAIARSKFGQDKSVEFIQLEKSDYVPAEDNSLDLLIMVRVSHHLPSIRPTIEEIHRVLRPGGKAIIEIASYDHMKNRLKTYARFNKLPKQPVQIGEFGNGIKDQTPFVNHNPHTIEAIFKDCRLLLIKKLSVSNFRSRKLKKMVGIKPLIVADRLLQSPLSSVYFGPSIFYLVGKK